MMNNLIWILLVNSQMLLHYWEGSLIKHSNGWTGSQDQMSWTRCLTTLRELTISEILDFNIRLRKKKGQAEIKEFNVMNVRVMVTSKLSAQLFSKSRRKEWLLPNLM